jgi:hypothetical protein
MYRGSPFTVQSVRECAACGRGDDAGAEIAAAGWFVGAGALDKEQAAAKTATVKRARSGGREFMFANLHLDEPAYSRRIKYYRALGVGVL